MLSVDAADQGDQEFDPWRKFYSEISSFSSYANVSNHLTEVRNI